MSAQLDMHVMHDVDMLPEHAGSLHLNKIVLVVRHIADNRLSMTRLPTKGLCSITSILGCTAHKTLSSLLCDAT